MEHEEHDHDHKDCKQDMFHFRLSRKIDMIFDNYKEVSMMILSLVVLIISLFSIYNVILNLYEVIVHQTRSLTSGQSLQSIFGTIFTVLIAFEFEETFLSNYHRTNEHCRDMHTLDHISAVILIGILALVRHILTINLETAELPQIVGISLLIVSLGFTYALLRRPNRTKNNK